MSTIIPQDYFDAQEVQSSIRHFCKEFKVGTLLRKSNFTKTKGVPCVTVFLFLFTLIFTGKNLYRSIHSQAVHMPLAKDTVYRFLNSERFNWRRFLFLLSSAVIKQKLNPITSKDRVNVLIFDDSPYKRLRSKSVELLSRFYDHVDRRYFKGFRLMTMGFSDGNTFIPLAFSLSSSPSEQKRLCDIKTGLDKRTNGYKRRKESFLKATDILLELLRQVKGLNIPVDYLLIDSWYAFPKVIRGVLKHNIQVICMVKALPYIFYHYRGKKMNLRQIYEAVEKRSSKDKIIASVTVEVGNGDEAFNARLVFVRNHNSKSQWLALLSTDTTLDDEEIIRIYGKRWGIEVFFKMAKSYLGLAKEFQGRSYDMMVAHTTVIFARYIMLAIKARTYEDPRAVGGLFFEYCDELEDIKFIQALNLLLCLLKQALKNCLVLSDKRINELINYFFGLLPRFYKDKLQLLNCES